MNHCKLIVSWQSLSFYLFFYFFIISFFIFKFDIINKYQFIIINVLVWQLHMLNFIYMNSILGIFEFCCYYLFFIFYCLLKIGGCFVNCGLHIFDILFCVWFYISILCLFVILMDWIILMISRIKIDIINLICNFLLLYNWRACNWLFVVCFDSLGPVGRGLLIY